LILAVVFVLLGRLATELR